MFTGGQGVIGRVPGNEGAPLKLGALFCLFETNCLGNVPGNKRESAADVFEAFEELGHGDAGN